VLKPEGPPVGGWVVPECVSCAFLICLAWAKYPKRDCMQPFFWHAVFGWRACFGS
jgi:hypothetical protein